MNAVKSDVFNLVDKELESANKQFPLFQSPHEGYAVMLEEVEELDELNTYIKNNIGKLWSDIRLDNDMETMFDKVEKIKKLSVLAACEAIQIAAMCSKFIHTFKDKE